MPALQAAYDDLEKAKSRNAFFLEIISTGFAEVKNTMSLESFNHSLMKTTSLAPQIDKLAEENGTMVRLYAALPG